jgi:hypothetical protein
MVAICGLICTDCPAYIATQRDDNEERREVAELWSSDQYPLAPEDINCDGCLTNGKRLCTFCLECVIRRCGFSRRVVNCAHCEEFPCENLKYHWQAMDAPEAKARLEEIRKGLE